MVGRESVLRKRERSGSLQKDGTPILSTHQFFLKMLYLLSNSLAQVGWLDKEEHVKARLEFGRKSHSEGIRSKSFNQSHMTKYGSVLLRARDLGRMETNEDV